MQTQARAASRAAQVAAPIVCRSLAASARSDLEQVITRLPPRGADRLTGLLLKPEVLYSPHYGLSMARSLRVGVFAPIASHGPGPRVPRAHIDATQSRVQPSFFPEHQNRTNSCASGDGFVRGRCAPVAANRHGADERQGP